MGILRLLASTGITGLLLLSGINQVQAQIGISPLIIELQDNNGQSQASINVINNTSKPFRARIYAEPFLYDRENGFTTVEASPESIIPYLRFSPRELNVPPGVTRRVRLNVKLPSNLPEGEYRGVIFAENLEQEQVTNQQGMSTLISTRIGVTLFVRKGNAEPEIKIDQASWDGNNRRIQLLVSNQGKASAFPRINWNLIKDGKIIKSGNIGANGVTAKNQRLVAFELPAKDVKDLSPGNYEISGDILWGERYANSTQFKTTINLLGLTTQK